VRILGGLCFSSTEALPVENLGVEAALRCEAWMISSVYTPCVGAGFVL
jgi:hypothetical protein